MPVDLETMALVTACLKAMDVDATLADQGEGHVIVVNLMIRDKPGKAIWGLSKDKDGRLAWGHTTVDSSGEVVAWGQPFFWDLDLAPEEVARMIIETHA